ncbi:hypothetical protein GR925_27315 [Streptomyces sp. HUCO-GS316]|uniref:hypothetical protein n=1 Tax=Streptomyces sp. HUCO-GS316 TaxID=2692198 RepID=UPI001367E7AF|nr:hypothetical protein [Streptomyces sp. HUCO-GS316]MXM67038.1 hypothetical protein [Streptomyces sp. HUCO-GS316]
MRKVAELVKVYETTVILVAMTAAQVAEWKWVGDEWLGEDPVQGWEVRDTTGALLGAILPLGHLATRLHVEYYDPEAGDFFSAGDTNAAVLKQGVARVLTARRHLGPIPAGEGFRLAPSHIPPVDCMYSRCAPGCDYCRTRDERAEAAAAPAAQPAPQGPPVQLELAFAA